MGSGYNFPQLQREIFLRSFEKVDWARAKTEWRVRNIFRVAEDEQCLCGHNPIHQICELFNELTRRTAEVGNVCVQKFLGLRSKRLFAALARVEADPKRSLNKDILEMYMHLGVVGAQEAEEYFSFYRKRKNITDEQMEFKQTLNNRIVTYAMQKAEEHRRAQAQLDTH